MPRLKRPRAASQASSTHSSALINLDDDDDDDNDILSNLVGNGDSSSVQRRGKKRTLRKKQSTQNKKSKSLEVIQIIDDDEDDHGANGGEILPKKRKEKKRESGQQEKAVGTKKDLNMVKERKNRSIDLEEEKKAVENESNEVLTCGICLEEVKERGIVDSCNDHLFCYDCIKEWSSQTNSCPSCRETFNHITKFVVPVNGSPNGAIAKIWINELKYVIGEKRAKGSRSSAPSARRPASSASPLSACSPAELKKIKTSVRKNTISVSDTDQRGSYDQVELDARLHAALSQMNRAPIHLGRTFDDAALREQLNLIFAQFLRSRGAEEEDEVDFFEDAFVVPDEFDEEDIEFEDEDEFDDDDGLALELALSMPSSHVARDLGRRWRGNRNRQSGIRQSSPILIDTPSPRRPGVRAGSTNRSEVASLRLSRGSPFAASSSSSSSRAPSSTRTTARAVASASVSSRPTHPSSRSNSSSSPFSGRASSRQAAFFSAARRSRSASASESLPYLSPSNQRNRRSIAREQREQNFQGGRNQSNSSARVPSALFLPSFVPLEAGETAGETAECPICSKSFSQHLINSHVNACLDAQS